MEQRAIELAQAVDQTTSGDERLDDRPQLGGIEPSAASGAGQDRPDVAGTADAHVRPLRQQPASLVGLIEPTRDDDAVGGRLQRPASRRDGPKDVYAASRSRMSGNSSNSPERASIRRWRGRAG